MCSCPGKDPRIAMLLGMVLLKDQKPGHMEKVRQLRILHLSSISLSHRESDSLSGSSRVRNCSGPGSSADQSKSSVGNAGVSERKQGEVSRGVRFDEGDEATATITSLLMAQDPRMRRQCQHEGTAGGPHGQAVRSEEGDAGSHELCPKSVEVMSDSFLCAELVILMRIWLTLC